MSFRYVALGDSQSEGLGDTPWPDGTPRGWTDRLAGYLSAQHEDFEYANLAVRVCGRTKYAGPSYGRPSSCSRIWSRSLPA